MWTSHSTSCWMCLLTLAVVMFFSALQVDSNILGLSCCHGSQSRVINDIQRCYEQKPRKDCDYHAFVIITSSNKKVCVKPTSLWIKRQLKEGQLNCPPEFMKIGRSEVLEEDDME